MRALIVEPNVNQQRELVSVLRMAGQDVQLARSRQQAQELARGQRMHLILVDAALEGQSEGLFLLEELRQQGRIGAGTIVVVLDTVRETRHERAAEELHVDAYLVKPFSQSDLLSLLGDALQRKRTLRPLEDAIAQNNPEEILFLTETLLKAAPQFEEQVLTARGNALIGLGRWDDAEELFDTAYLAHPEAGWARLGAARAALAANRIEEALAYLQPPYPTHPDLLPAYDLLARAHIARGAYRHAQHALREAAQLSPLNLTRLRELIRLALLNGDRRVANEAGSQLVRRGKDAAQLTPADCINVVRCAVLLERPGVAPELLQEAQTRFPGNPDLAVLQSLVDAHEALRTDNIGHAQRRADHGRQLSLEAPGSPQGARLAADISTPEVILASIETCTRVGLPLSGLALAQALAEAQQSGSMSLTPLDARLLTRYQDELEAGRVRNRSTAPPPAPKPRSWLDKLYDWLETPLW